MGPLVGVSLETNRMTENESTTFSKFVRLGQFSNFSVTAVQVGSEETCEQGYWFPLEKIMCFDRKEPLFYA